MESGAEGHVHTHTQTVEEILAGSLCFTHTFANEKKDEYTGHFYNQQYR